MKTKIGKGSFFFAIFPILLILGTAIPFYIHYLDRVTGEMVLVDTLILDDGETGFTVRRDDGELKINQVDVATGAVQKKYTVKSFLLDAIYLLPSPEGAVLIAPRDEFGGLIPYDIYLFPKDKEPIVLDTFYEEVAFIEPVYWQGNFCVISTDEKRSHIFTVVKDRKVQSVYLDSIPEFEAGISSITNWSGNYSAETINMFQVLLGNGQTYVLACYLDEGRAVYIPSGARDNDNETAALTLGKKYLGDQQFALTVEDGDGKARIGVFYAKDATNITNGYKPYVAPSQMEMYKDISFYYYNMEMKYGL